MKHFASPAFWDAFEKLPNDIQRQAKNNYQKLKGNPRHPSLHFKRVDPYWSVRITRGYRALGIDIDGGVLWGWIGSHADYDRLIR